MFVTPLRLFHPVLDRALRAASARGTRRWWWQQQGSRENSKNEKLLWAVPPAKLELEGLALEVPAGMFEISLLRP